MIVLQSERCDSVAELDLRKFALAVALAGLKNCYSAVAQSQHPALVKLDLGAAAIFYPEPCTPSARKVDGSRRPFRCAAFF